MYKGLALKSGVLLAMMLFLNGMLGGVIGPYYSNLIFHLIGLLLICMIAVIRKNQWVKLNEIPKMFFLPGILSALIVLLNNICIPKLGITLVVGISLFGQLIVSNLIDHYGLFEMEVKRFKKEKLVGFSIILVGMFAMLFL
ncbi:DMT family transporter [Marinisporobacter balticus]|uniref:Transporter family-2 protein n=1 Tax=Marinisporobacter balticus TaxID=2018667 RepID=A0A4V2SB91_9FIRM|nr:DMT family transporter [Marinisporobacter balticus]TCO74610.1 transporter family-2 protein [Marinisporobacter balticus]